MERPTQSTPEYPEELTRIARRLLPSIENIAQLQNELADSGMILDLLSAIDEGNAEWQIRAYAEWLTENVHLFYGAPPVQYDFGLLDGGAQNSGTRGS